MSKNCELIYQDISDECLNEFYNSIACNMICVHRRYKCTDEFGDITYSSSIETVMSKEMTNKLMDGIKLIGNIHDGIG